MKVSNRSKIVVFMLVVLSASAFAELPKVAVLDAVLPKGIEMNVSVVVTEKLSEQLVKSGKYVVLDRTTVGQSLKEIEFQMSGLVSDADLKKAGAQLSTRLGASYVVVAQVSVVSGTYFVSAKMIDLKTGEITAQASDEEEGKVSVIFKIAERAGSKLAAGARAADASTEAATTQSAAEGKEELPDRSPLPVVPIKIDGHFEDWKSVTPAFIAPQYAKEGDLIIDKVYLAVDYENLYMRMDIKDGTPSTFAHPNNFHKKHARVSYGLDVKSTVCKLILELILLTDSGNQWSARIARLDLKGQNWWVASGPQKYSMKGSSFEAAFPLLMLKKHLGPLSPSTYYQISARTGYPGAAEWVKIDGTPEKSFTF